MEVLPLATISRQSSLAGAVDQRKRPRAAPANSFPQPSNRGATADLLFADLSSESLSPPRIAIYADSSATPVVVSAPALPTAPTEIPAFTRALAEQTFDLVQHQGGRLPVEVFRELLDNLVHAAFREVVITILDGGNTVRISDHGPGIADKEAALQPGFTSANSCVKQFIRGVGAGFTIVKELLTPLEGVLELEDNLDHGTVVTVRVPPTSKVFTPSASPAYNLSQRQLKALLLAVELAPVGPTRLAEELGVSTSTAYRDLLLLEGMGLVSITEAGQREVTAAGLAYLDALF